MSNILFTKVYSVKSPNRGHLLDAGTDFFIPDYSEQFIADLGKKNKNNDVKCYLGKIDDYDELRMIIEIGPHSQVNIPSGIKLVIPKGKVLVAMNKSGVATKYGLTVGACVIDENYRGVVHLNLINTTDHPVKLLEGQKILQCVELDYGQDLFEEIDGNEFSAQKAPDDRGDKGFGEGTGTF